MPPARCDSRAFLASLSLLRPLPSLPFSTLSCFSGCFSSGFYLLLSPPLLLFFLRVYRVSPLFLLLFPPLKLQLVSLVVLLRYPSYVIGVAKSLEIPRDSPARWKHVNRSVRPVRGGSSTRFLSTHSRKKTRDQLSETSCGRQPDNGKAALTSMTRETLIYLAVLSSRHGNSLEQ